MLLFQPAETKKKVSGFICPNVSCGKTFTQPLKASNLRVSAEPYNACPYCLTEVSPDQEPVLLTSKSHEAATQTNLSTKDSESKLPDCKNHFGYLGERSGKEIPDECLMCRAIVQCMLKGKESVGA